MAELNAGIFQVGPDISGGEAQRRFLARLKQVAVETGRPVMFGTISSRQGDGPNPWTYQLEYLDDCAAAGGAHVGADHHPLDQRHLLAQVLPAVRRAAGLAASCARCRSPSRSAASPIPRRAGN